MLSSLKRIFNPISKLNARKFSLKNAKVVCALYDDPVEGYPPEYPRDSIPELPGYSDFRKMNNILHGGQIHQTLPTPKGIDFKPG